MKYRGGDRFRNGSDSFRDNKIKELENTVKERDKRIKELEWRLEAGTAQKAAQGKHETERSIPSTSDMLEISISQDHVTTQDFVATISETTELYTKCLLIEQGRFRDLADYMQTHDAGHIEGANLPIGKLSHNSPVLIEIIIASPTMALALRTAIDAIVQTKARLDEKKLSIEEKELDIEKKRADLEKERMKLLEEAAHKIVTQICPKAVEEVKEILAQFLLPSLSQLAEKELTKPPSTEPAE